jgi:hypothetical protein
MIFIQSCFDIGLAVPFLMIIGGTRIREPKKYRNPAIVSGPRDSRPNLTTTNVDDQMMVTSNASKNASLRLEDWGMVAGLV